MPRRIVQFEQGQYYHLYNRTAGNRLLFPEAENGLYLLGNLKRLAGEHCIAVIAYCLMPNHYHLLVRQDGVRSPSQFLGRLFNGYTKALNLRHGLNGTLFEERFQAIHVDQEPYVMHLCRYIHANPVRAGLVRRPEEWAFSNYQEWIGTRAGSMVDIAFVRDRFADAEAYADFVADYIDSMAHVPKGAGRYELD